MIALLDGPPINLIISALLRRSRLIKIKCNNISIIRASFKWARAWRTLKTCDGGTNGVRRMTAKAFNTRQPWPFPTVTVCIPIRDHSNRLTTFTEVAEDSSVHWDAPTWIATLTLHFRPQQWTCGAHLRAGGASGPGEAPGEPLIAPWSLIRQPPG